MNKEEILERLKGFDFFKGAPEDQLKWLVDHSELETYEADDILINSGEPINRMIIVLEGEIKTKLRRGDGYVTLPSMVTGGVTGKLPFSRLEKVDGILTILKPTKILNVYADIYPELAKHYELIEIFAHALSDRVRRFTSDEQQNEKLMALGKLSAGLAHELNNPASAMVRGATELKKNLGAKPEKFKDMMSIRMTNDQIDAVNEVVFKKASQGSSNQQSLMERTALEDELTDWMDDNEVEEGFEYSNTFAEFCFTTDDLDTIKDIVGDEYLSQVLSWIEDVLTTERMVEEIEDGARRISELVSSVKTYSHMDRGNEKEAVNLRKNVKSTITMLNHKARQKQVELSMEIPTDLPPFYGFVSELNQVWMNLLDNAIDAVEDKGQIRIVAEAKKEDLILHFMDNGAGIPKEKINHIFEPFFTTKGMGQGTGLGLDVVHKIVSKHSGTINVKSEPGNTVFTLVFPFQ